MWCLGIDVLDNSDVNICRYIYKNGKNFNVWWLGLRLRIFLILIIVIMKYMYYMILIIF